jgi:cardiolipin synthase
VFKAIDNAQQKVILETFIWFEDDVGKQLHSVLLRAARAASKLKCCWMAMARRISAMRSSMN